MAIKRVAAHRRAGKPVRSHARRHMGSKAFWALPTFKAKLAHLRSVSGMPDAEARGVLAKMIRKHEGAE